MTIKIACIEAICLNALSICWGRLMSQLFRIANSEIDIALRGCRRRPTRSALICGAVALACFSSAAKADEGGVNFWIPGFFGSLAAAPLQPGWTLQTN